MKEDLEDMITRHEGIRLKPYKDSVGKLTIGIGRNLDDRGITEAEARMMLKYDIAIAEEALLKYPWYLNLDQVRKEILINMMFNLGSVKFHQFKRLHHFIANKDYQNAAEEMIQSKWCIQVGNRAKELAAMMVLGQYVDNFK